MEVKKIMTKNPACCTSDSTVQEVAHMMEMYDCGCIPVVEDHKTNRPIGTITDRDIAIRAVAESGSVSRLKASDIMTTDIATVTPETTVEACRDQMEERQIRRILVVDKSGKCVGIVAQADIVQHESNPKQTAEFIRDISQSSGSQYGGAGAADYNQFGVRDREMGGSSYGNYGGGTALDRDSYRNFSSRNASGNRGYEFDYAQHDDRRDESFSKPSKKFKKVRREKKSFFSLSMLLPLLVSIGAGAALKYYMGVDKQSQTTFVPRAEVETTPKVSIELPTTETTHTQTNIEMRDGRDIGAGTGIGTATASMSNADSLLEIDTDNDTKVGRTARL